MILRNRKVAFFASDLLRTDERAALDADSLGGLLGADNDRLLHEDDLAGHEAPRGHHPAPAAGHRGHGPRGERPRVR